MWELLSSRLGIAESELLARVSEIDMRDGVRRWPHDREGHQLFGLRSSRQHQASALYLLRRGRRKTARCFNRPKLHCQRRAPVPGPSPGASKVWLSNLREIFVCLGRCDRRCARGTGASEELKGYNATNHTSFVPDLSDEGSWSGWLPPNLDYTGRCFSSAPRLIRLSQRPNCSANFPCERCTKCRLVLQSHRLQAGVKLGALAGLRS